MDRSHQPVAYITSVDMASTSGSTKPSDPNWIENAGLNRGSLTRKAKSAGMGVQSFAKKNDSSPGKLGKQSRLAETLSKLRRKGATI